MHPIDMATWPRRPLFEFFNELDYPHFSLCAPLDVSHFYPAIKAHALPFTLAVVYVLARTANTMPCFRQRIHGHAVVEYEVIDPSMTLLGEDELFAFCTMPYRADFKQFAEQAQAAMARSRQTPSLSDEGRDDLFFMSSIPWVAFSNITHPIHMRPVDSVPRLTWGKVSQTEGKLHMPLAIQVHHALMDGLHVGRFFGQVQTALDAPAAMLGIDWPI